MKHIYDESGKKIAEYFDSSSAEDIQKDYLDKKTFISELDLGENAIIENDQIRAETRLDRILKGAEELQDGEYITGKEIITVEKPDNFHIWDSKKKKWIYEKQLEIGFINSEILNKEIELNDLYGTLDKATSRRLKALIAYTQGKIDKIKEELETHENRLKELEV